MSEPTIPEPADLPKTAQEVADAFVAHCPAPPVDERPCPHVWHDYGALGGRNVSWCSRCDMLAFTGQEDGYEPVSAALSPLAPPPAPITVAALAKAADRKMLPIMRALNVFGADVTANRPLDLALIGAALSNAGCRLSEAPPPAPAVQPEPHDLRIVFMDLVRQVDEFIAEQGEASFYTGPAHAMRCLLLGTPLPEYLATGLRKLLSESTPGASAPPAATPTADQGAKA